MTQRKKFTTINDRRRWAEKVMYKYNELCVIAKHKKNSQNDTV